VGTVRLEEVDWNKVREWVELGGRVRFVHRGGRVYVVLYKPKEPSEAQLRVRRQLAEAAREASRMTVEEVASLVGGEVVEVEGRKLVKLPDGRVLDKNRAYVAFKMKKRS
jgi:hypothetical protein